MFHYSEKVNIRMMPGVPGCVVGWSGIAAVCEGGFPIWLTFEFCTMAAAAFGLVDRSTPHDLYFVLRIGWGRTVRSKNNEDDPYYSDREGCAHGDYSPQGFIPPGTAANASDSIRSLPFLSHSPSGHRVPSSILAVDIQRPCQMVYGAGRVVVTVTGESRLAMLRRIPDMDTPCAGHRDGARGNRTMRTKQGTSPWILGSVAVRPFHAQP